MNDPRAYGFAVGIEEAPLPIPAESNGADLILHYLHLLNVEVVFGIPGGALEPFFDGLARAGRRQGLQVVVARHEAGAAFMADGYARETGRLGVCCATTGPGATNLITGVATAFENEVPLLVITAQTPLPLFGRKAFQDSSSGGVDTVAMLSHCTRYSTLVSHPDQLERSLVTAIMSAMQAPRGPVHLSIPPDVFRAPAVPSSINPDLLTAMPSIVDEHAVAELMGAVTASRRRLLVLGPGCGEAIGLIHEFALATRTPFLTTPDAKGLVSPYHPLYRGVFGFAGHASAYAALEDPELDLVIAVGCDMGEWATAGWNPRLFTRRLVHVDAVNQHLTRSPMAALHVRGRILSVFRRLVATLHEEMAPGTVRLGSVRESIAPPPRVERAPIPDGVAPPPVSFAVDEKDKCESAASPVKPQRLMADLARLFPYDTLYLADTGNALAWATHYLHPRDRRAGGTRGALGGVLRLTLNFAAMGWAIGASVGTAVAAPGRPVVCLTGDGSFLMNGQEITVAVEHRLSVVFVVLNDGAFGLVKHGQRLTGAEPIGFALPPVDFAAMARAMGAEGHTIRTPQDLAALDIAELCRRSGPTLLDVRVDPEEVPPIGVRVAGLTA